MAAPPRGPSRSPGAAHILPVREFPWPRSRWLHACLAPSLLAALGAGCVHRVPTSWDAAAHIACAGSTCFHAGDLGTPWLLVRKEDGAVGFFSPAGGGVVEAKATCRDDAEAAPLSSLTNQLLIGYTDRRVRAVERLLLDGHETLHSVIETKLDGLNVILDLYVTRRNGCIYDLSYAAAPGRYGDGLPAFRRFVAGFAAARSAS